MNALTLNDLLLKRRLPFHLAIVTVSIILPVILSLADSGKIFAEYTLNLFILLVVQLELFLLIAFRIFRELQPAATRKELTKTVLLRFSLFMVICFFTALIINILFILIRNLAHGYDSYEALMNFFKNGFGAWCKSTVGGLLFGAAIFIFIQWQDALKREQKLREENLIFQNETLKNQVNPHFLFNSLNTLSSLISTQPDTADRFIERLSSIYRYILENSSKDKVLLQNELNFIRDYFFLHKIRDEDKILLEISVGNPEKYMILPVSLQILVENAIKHNMATRDNPLKIFIYSEADYIVVRNNLQKKAVQLNSTGIGLKNLIERIRLITGKALIIDETNSEYIVKIPLIS
jgi:two-component system, LytTR family, sensor kinase